MFLIVWAFVHGVSEFKGHCEAVSVGSAQEVEQEDV